MFNVARGKSRKIQFLDGTWIPQHIPNPCEGVNLAKRKPVVYSPKFSELAAFIRNLEDSALRPDYREILLFQARTCSRISEVCGMRWDELDDNDV